MWNNRNLRARRKAYDRMIIALFLRENNMTKLRYVFIDPEDVETSYERSIRVQKWYESELRKDEMS